MGITSAVENSRAEVETGSRLKEGRLLRHALETSL